MRGLVAMAALLLLGRAFDCAASEIPHFGYDDSWSYSGEVERRPDAVLTCRTAYPCKEYCSDGRCAHGFGHVTSDGDWNYDGFFVHGRFEGQGTIDTASYIYSGTFKGGLIDGHGVLECSRKKPYESTFPRTEWEEVYAICRRLPDAQ